MRKTKPGWKLAIAILSLLLTAWVWQKGLQESFQRPSVGPRLSLRQNEMALMASPSLPEAIKPILVGLDPSLSLKGVIQEIPLEAMTAKEKIVLASLERSKEDRTLLLKENIQDQSLETIRKKLLIKDPDKLEISRFFIDLKEKNIDPLVYRVSCNALSGDPKVCIDNKVSKLIALRLGISQLLPFSASLLGVLLLIRELWKFLRKKNNNWPALTSLPLSLLDMVLLVSGGFVVLGEVVFPAFAVPLIDQVTKHFSSPLNECLKVLFGYVVMTLPPLFILRKQLKSLDNTSIPLGGWLQWKVQPLGEAIRKAIRGWLMIMPLVLLTGFLMNNFVGDQGGSNPLLDLVLRSHEPLPLTLLLFTTVVLAPFFEELIFRGALLPALVDKFGRSWGIGISALVFALAHLSVGELPPLFVLGIGLAILRLSSGRLMPCALMHSLWNGITFSNLLLLG